MREGCYTLDYANKEDKFCFGGPEGVIYIIGINE
jgi:hypothetical protein